MQWRTLFRLSIRKRLGQRKRFTYILISSTAESLPGWKIPPTVLGEEFDCFILIRIRPLQRLEDFDEICGDEGGEDAGLHGDGGPVEVRCRKREGHLRVNTDCLHEVAEDFVYAVGAAFGLVSPKIGDPLGELSLESTEAFRPTRPLPRYSPIGAPTSSSVLKVASIHSKKNQNTSPIQEARLA